MSSFSVLVIIICAISCAFADVINLSQDTFATHVNGDTNALVEFYAPWCGHCKSLAPEWQIAGKTFKPSDDIIIAAVDATESPDLAQSFGIQGYPTIKFFPKGSIEPEDYNGGRTADTIVSWVNDKIGTRRKLSKGPPSSIVTLTTDNFEQNVFGPKSALVEFYAPWCGHCKTLAPKYEILANVFAGDKNVLIGQVDATEHGDLATKFDVGGYPTLKFFPSGQSEPINYEDAREVEDMVAFINRHAGTFRNADGSLTGFAGIVDELNSIIGSADTYADINDSFLNKLISAANNLEGDALAFGKTYVSIAKKIIEKGADYLSKELTRLEGMVSNPSIVPESKTKFQLKMNVLRAFMKEN